MKHDPLRRLRSGALWLGGGQLLSQAVSLLATVVIARHVGPEAYGAFALISFTLGVPALCKELGLTSAVTTGRLADETHLSAAHTAVLCAGLSITVGLWTFSGRIATLVGLAGSELALEAACLSVFLSSASVIPGAYLQGQSRFESLAKLGITQQLCCSATGIGLALAGVGVWALVVPLLLAPVVSLLGTWSLLGRLPPLRFNLGVLGAYRKEAAEVMGFGVFNYLTRNADNLIIGTLFGQVALGHYSLAYTLMKRPVSLVVGALGPPLQAQLPSLAGDPSRRDGLVSRVLIELARFATPALFVAAASCQTWLPLLFGPDWAASVPIAQILLPLGALQVLGSTFGPLWLALGATGLLFRWGLWTGLGSVCVFVTGAYLGDPTWVAGCYAAYSGILLGASFHLTRKLHIALSDTKLPLLWIYLSSSFAAGVTYSMLCALGPWFSPTAVVIASICSGCTTFAGIEFARQRTRAASSP